MQSHQSLTLLKANNGHKWLSDITSSFYKNDLIKIIDGSSAKPADPTSDAYEKWVKLDNLAKALVHDSLSSDFRSYLDWSLSAKKNMDILKKLVEDKSQAAIRSSRKQLESLKMNASQDMNAFFNKFHQLFVQFIDAGGKISQLEQVEIFLQALPNAKSIR